MHVKCLKSLDKFFPVKHLDYQSSFEKLSSMRGGCHGLRCSRGVARIFAQEGPQRMLRGPTFADMTGHIIIISKYIFCDNGEKMCQFCALIFLLKLINFLKKDFPRRGPVFCHGGPGPMPPS